MTKHYSEEIVMDPRRIEKIIDKRAFQEFLKENSKCDSQKSHKFFSTIQQDFIREKVNDLPTIELMIVHLLFWKNLKLEDISKKLGLSVENVSTLKESALKRLRKKYFSEFTTYEQNELNISNPERIQFAV